MKAYVISGYYRDDGGAVETTLHLHATREGARDHLADIIENDISERPDEYREIHPGYYLSTTQFGEERYELDITEQEIGE